MIRGIKPKGRLVNVDHAYTRGHLAVLQQALVNQYFEETGRDRSEPLSATEKVTLLELFELHGLDVDPDELATLPLNRAERRKLRRQR